MIKSVFKSTSGLYLSSRNFLKDLERNILGRSKIWIKQDFKQPKNFKFVKITFVTSSDFKDQVNSDIALQVVYISEDCKKVNHQQQQEISK